MAVSAFAQSPLPTGTVQVYLNGNQGLCSGTLDANGNTNCINQLAGGIGPGTYPVTVAYSGDSVYAPFTSPPQNLTVAADTNLPVNVTFQMSPNPVGQGNTVTSQSA